MARKPLAKTKASPPVEHGIGSAAYVRTALGLEPTLFCLCGFAAQGSEWQDAGAELDFHLAEET